MKTCKCFTIACALNVDDKCKVNLGECMYRERKKKVKNVNNTECSTSC
jgi:hypothetical protein